MRNTNSSLSAGIKNHVKNERPRAIQSTSYQNIAGGLASEMVDVIRSTEPRGSCPPFRLVIVGNHGDVVFEGEVNKDWKVRPWGSLRSVHRSHFPATALLTDRSLVTRTFLIERAALPDNCN